MFFNLIFCSFFLYWRAKRVLAGEVDGKLFIAVHASCMSYFCLAFVYWRVHGRFYRLDLKGTIHLGD